MFYESMKGLDSAKISKSYRSPCPGRIVIMSINVQMTLTASVYRPRRPRASPLWQIIHHGWDDFQSDYKQCYRKKHGPLRSDAIEVVEKFYGCGDLAQVFTRLHCKDCGHEKLLASTCKVRSHCEGIHWCSTYPQCSPFRRPPAAQFPFE